MKILKTLFVVGGLVTLASCSCAKNKFDSNKASADKIISTLNNTTWSLKRLDVENRDFKPTEDQKQLLLSFEDVNYGTNDGCNVQGGEFEAKDNQIIFKPGMSTMRYCGEEMAHLIYQVPLTKTKSIKIVKDQLQLFDANSNVIATYIKKI